MALQFGLPLPPRSQSSRVIETEWEADRCTGLRDRNYSLSVVSVQPHSYSLVNLPAPAPSGEMLESLTGPGAPAGQNAADDRGNRFHGPYRSQ